MGEKEEKIKRLEILKSRLNSIKASESGIDKLSDLIHLELQNELTLAEQNHVYVSNLKQTIEKQLKRLKDSRKKPENRIDEMNECKYHFNQDIDRYIGDLEFT